MKKQPRKLTLCKETLKGLDEQGLRDVNGGTGTLQCSFDRCPYSWVTGPLCAIDSDPCW